MRRSRHTSWLAMVIAAVLLLIVGTVLGRALPLGPLSLQIGFAPVSLNLYVASISVGIETNVLGLIGAFVGLILSSIF